MPPVDHPPPQGVDPSPCSHTAAALNDVTGIPSISGPRGDAAPSELFVAVVHTADTVRWTTSATSLEDLVDELAEYVRRSRHDALFADDAALVGEFLATGDAEAAVAHYFAAVGRRWDAEWLVTVRVGVAAPAQPICLAHAPLAKGTVYRPTTDDRGASTDVAA